jgi:integrase
MKDAKSSAFISGERKRKRKTTAWNKGKALGQKRAFTAQEVSEITSMLRREKRPLAVRDLALIRMGIDTMLRSSDLLDLLVSDIVRSGAVVTEIDVMQKKTRKPVSCNLMPETQDAILLWAKQQWGEDVPVNQRLFPITTRQHGNIIKAMAGMIKLDQTRYGTHSIRRTKAVAVYAKTKNHEIVRQMLGHQNLGWTHAYLGVDREDARAISIEVRI